MYCFGSFCTKLLLKLLMTNLKGCLPSLRRQWPTKWRPQRLTWHSHPADKMVKSSKPKWISSGLLTVCLFAGVFCSRLSANSKHFSSPPGVTSANHVRDEPTVQIYFPSDIRAAGIKDVVRNFIRESKMVCCLFPLVLSSYFSSKPTRAVWLELTIFPCTWDMAAGKKRSSLTCLCRPWP